MLARIASTSEPAAGVAPHRRAHLILGAMVLAYAAVYSILAAIRFHFYLYSDFDLAIFAQAVDGILHGRTYSSIRGMGWLGDHSSLVLFLLAPFYALVRHPLTLLVIQASAQALGAIPVYALARRELGHSGLALACAAAYLLQPALGYSSQFEFHPELLATAPLLAAFYSLRCGRLGPTVLWSVVALLCREDVALVVFMMALYALSRREPGRFRMALVLLNCAAASVFVTWGLLRPALNAGEAEYARIYQHWGDTIGQAAGSMLRYPHRVVRNLFITPGSEFDTLVKQQFHLTLFLPLGLLPLLSPLTLAIALPIFVEHLMSWRVPQHTILCQYTALTIPFVSAAAVIGLRNLFVLLRHGRAGRGQRLVVDDRSASVAIAGLLAAALGCQVWFGPLLSSGKFLLTGANASHLPTAEERTRAAWLDRMVAAVPRRGAVVASYELLDRFTHRDSVHSLHHVVSGRYTFSSRPYPSPQGVSALVADLAGVNIVPLVESASARRLQVLARDNRLQPVMSADDLVLFETNARTPLDLLAPDRAPADSAPALLLDQELAYLGGAVLDPVGRPGGTVTLHTWWRRVGWIDRHFQTRFDLVDDAGRVVPGLRRYLGYLLWPPHTWAPNQTMRETYRLILYDDLRPGDYRVRMRVVWRLNSEAGAAEGNDPSRYSPEQGIELGHVRVVPGASGR